MAIINCPACNERMSSAQTVCPQCGTSANDEDSIEFRSESPRDAGELYFVVTLHDRIVVSCVMARSKRHAESCASRIRKELASTGLFPFNFIVIFLRFVTKLRRNA